MNLLGKNDSDLFISLHLILSMILEVFLCIEYKLTNILDSKNIYSIR